jgi:hypothetical protein
VGLVAVLVVVAVLVGGFLEVPHESGAYDSGYDRSLASQGSVVASESSVTGATVRQLMSTMQTLGRQALQVQLDGAVQQAQAQSALAQTAAGSSGGDSMAARFAAVFAERASAVAAFRTAVDGLLGMHPLPVAGASASAPAETPTLLTSTQATDRIAAAGALLRSADGTYRLVRQDLAQAAGHHHLPASVWVTNPQTWEPGAVADQVDLVAASSSLAAVHRLVLRSVQLSPPALPTSPASSGTSVLTPTSQIQVTVVLADLGTVDEPHARVQFVLTAQASGTQVSQLREAAVASGGSVTLPSVTFSVKSGRIYQLTVSVVLPASQSATSGTSQTQTLEIAPGT